MTAGTTSSAAGLPAARPSGDDRTALKPPRDDDRQYVTVGVDEEIFAFDVHQVREVLDLMPFTRMPNMPPVVRGMINLGKRSVPVFDIRVKFGLPPAEPTPNTRIVVLDIPFGDHSVVVGALTDRVYEVTALDSGDLEAPPEIGAASEAEAIQGLGRRKGRIVIILNAAKVFSDTDLSLAIRRRGDGHDGT